MSQKLPVVLREPPTAALHQFVRGRRLVVRAVRPVFPQACHCSSAKRKTDLVCPQASSPTMTTIRFLSRPGSRDRVREIVQLEQREALYRTGDLAPGLPEVAPGDAAQIQYTSGTTGFPKGAVLSHRNLVNNARLFAARANTHQGSVWASFMPLFHTAGCATGGIGESSDRLQDAAYQVFRCRGDRPADREREGHDLFRRADHACRIAGSARAGPARYGRAAMNDRRADRA